MFVYDQGFKLRLRLRWCDHNYGCGTSKNLAVVTEIAVLENLGCDFPNWECSNRDDFEKDFKDCKWSRWFQPQLQGLWSFGNRHGHICDRMDHICLQFPIIATELWRRSQLKAFVLSWKWCCWIWLFDHLCVSWVVLRSCLRLDWMNEYWWIGTMDCWTIFIWSF